MSHDPRDARGAPVSAGTPGSAETGGSPGRADTPEAPGNAEPQGSPRSAELREAPGSAAEAWVLPWAEPFGGTAGGTERARLAAEFGAALRRTGSLMQLMGQAAADRIGINATDLNCLNILSFRGQMTAGELARETGLTTASITGVVDRLEKAGYVRRERDSGDRRRVVVQLVLERAIAHVASVFLPMVRAWQQMADRYTDDELRLILGFYDQMAQMLREHIALLRQSAPAPGATPPAGAGQAPTGPTARDSGTESTTGGNG
jgi:DNA-binding MarR family transcriptional regulator